MDLSAPVTFLPGIGPAIAGKLGKIDITSVFDLIYHLPFRYEDRSQITAISQTRLRETVTIVGQISSIKNGLTKNRRFIQRATISDQTGSIEVIWFNQTFLTRLLRAGESVALHGKVDFFGRNKALISPDYELINKSTDHQSLIHMARVVPIYPETSGITSKWLRTKIYNLLPTLPEEIYACNLPAWKKSLSEVHFPTRLPVDEFKKRLAFDELLLLQLKSLTRKAAWQKTRLSHIFSVPYPQIRQFIAALPFSLTLSQHQAIDEILIDLSTPHPMNRLLEGDVGSGKTVVAAVAAYAAHLSGFQTLVLAPTQILATQHYQTLSALFAAFNIKVSLITGSQKLVPNSQSLTPITVGTHALLNKSFPNVGLIVIDEQHRFGVAQRALAVSKGESPHILTMTATPIPRTIALTIHGDLSLSILSELPADRLPVKTWVVPESKRSAAYEWIGSQLTANSSQLFVVCPFISESESQASVKAAAAEFEKLKSVFSAFRLGLLHGKQKSKDRDEIVSRFRAGGLDILVSTPLVEVGLDVPNATIMVIESADRYGLAQLHQLRGRVGRSPKQSYCLLFAPPTSRVKALESHTSGQQLAEIDLRLRGPGEIFGTAQSGLPHFKAASYDDLGLIESAHTHASKILPDLKKYPLLRKLVNEDKIDQIQPN